MSFGIKINALLTAMLLVGITFMFAVNAASAQTPNDTYHTLGAWDYTWHTAAVKIAGNSTKYYLDGVEKYTTSGSISVNQINFYSAGPTGNFYFDYIRIHKYDSPEPVWA